MGGREREQGKFSFWLRFMVYVKVLMFCLIVVNIIFFIWEGEVISFDFRLSLLQKESFWFDMERL